MMKNKTRTWMGKALLFFLTLVLLSIFATGLIGTILMEEEGMYVNTWQEIEEYIHPVYRGFFLWAYENRITIPILSVICGIGAIFSFIALMCVTGRRPGSDELYPGPMQVIPFDLMLVGTGAFIVLAFVLGGELLAAFWNTGSAIMLMGILMIGFFGVCVAFSMNVAGHIKQKDLITGTLIYRILRAVVRGSATLIRSLPVLGWAVVLIGVILLVEVIAFGATGLQEDKMLGFWFIERLILVPALLWLALQLKKLEKGGKAIAEGDTSYVIETKHMYAPFKRHAENLNSVASGMQNAIDKQLKSERMRTELITNVSHDIKTPLTSIINYTDLISREETDNENIKEYTEVLTRQSTRLKRLIEDLVEASKASTGNLEVELVPTQAKVLLSQAAGEYEERFEQLGLEPVLKMPEEEVRLLADGRRMWRIFDNLLNNICKYSQTGTRVYITLQKEAENAVFSFMNISKEPLGISADELKERFVRGDVSRNTEGSGLGLSIAESLAKLQNGQLDLQIEGDLFKAILTFPALP